MRSPHDRPSPIFGLDDDAWLLFAATLSAPSKAALLATCQTLYNRLFEEADANRVDYFLNRRHASDDEGTAYPIPEAIFKERKMHTQFDGRRGVFFGLVREDNLLLSTSCPVLMDLDEEQARVDRTQWASVRSVMSPSDGRTLGQTTVHYECEGMRCIYPTTADRKDKFFWNPKDVFTTITQDRIAVRMTSTLPFDEAAEQLHMPDGTPVCGSEHAQLSPPEELCILPFLGLEEADVQELLSQDCCNCFTIHQILSDREYAPLMAEIPHERSHRYRCLERDVLATVSTRWFDVRGARLRLHGCCYLHGYDAAEAVEDLLQNVQPLLSAPMACDDDADDSDEEGCDRFDTPVYTFKWLPDEINGKSMPWRLRAWMKKWFDPVLEPDFDSARPYRTGKTYSTGRNAICFNEMPSFAKGSTRHALRLLWSSRIHWKSLEYDLGPAPKRMANARPPLEDEEDEEEDE